MDLEFFMKRINTVTTYQCRSILSKRDKAFYFLNIVKIKDLFYKYDRYGTKSVDTFHSLLNHFENEQESQKRFFQSSRILTQAFRDARDVLEGMRRYDGMDFFDNQRDVGSY